MRRRRGTASALHRMRDHLGGQVGADVLDAGHAARRGDQRLAQRRNLALRRIAELDVEGNVAALDLQVLQLLRRDEVFARVRVGDALQGFEEGGIRGGHESGFIG